MILDLTQVDEEVIDKRPASDAQLYAVKVIEQELHIKYEGPLTVRSVWEWMQEHMEAAAQAFVQRKQCEVTAIFQYNRNTNPAALYAQHPLFRSWEGDATPDIAHLDRRIAFYSAWLLVRSNAFL